MFPHNFRLSKIDFESKIFLNAILFNISWIPPLEKGHCLNKLEFKSAFVTSLLVVEIGPVILVKKSKLERFTGRRPDRQTDTRTVHVSFMLRWAKKLRKPCDLKQQTYLGFCVKHNQLKYFLNFCGSVWEYLKPQ